ncbi:uncharacterized protein A4U43_C07F21910 [Asparagus officinalis]|uniref:Reverse transcriptase Ty1/copia-type domain-containing protein n=1 Tax=Asparagus officinalis TaxID=4686 RepID=A0A5P1EE77_ASPOF|nr:uncharacterized protein A4U43_C07F21910 [Asparagus officinalis]
MTDGHLEDTMDGETQEHGHVQESIAANRPRMVIRRLTTYNDVIVAYALSIEVVDDMVPSTFREAESSSNSIRWMEAMEEEIRSLQKNDTWKLAKLPKGKKAIGCKWVYMKKDGSSIGDIRYKDKFVAKGYAQLEGIDYNKIFSSVVKHSSIQILLALVAQLD